MTTEEPDELPEVWALARVGEYFESWGGATPSTAVNEFWGGRMPWISSNGALGPGQSGFRSRVMDSRGSHFLIR